MDRLLSVVLGLTLSTLGLISLPFLIKKQEPAQPNTLRWHAEKALAEGKHQTSITPPSGDYVGADNTPEEILEYANIVVAQPVDSHTGTVGDSDIITWYKFKIVETLSEGIPSPRKYPNLTLPDAILPVSEDEFIMSRHSGTMTVDGVEISVFNNKFPPYSKDKQYLFFLTKTGNKKASLLVGPAAVFTVSHDGTLEPASGRTHPFKEFITRRFDASLEKLKQHLKQAREN
jgi:hypothetical protein